MTDLERASRIDDQIGLSTDDNIGARFATAWETSQLIASLLSRIEELERRLDKQEEYAQEQNEAQ